LNRDISFENTRFFNRSKNGDEPYGVRVFMQRLSSFSVGMSGDGKLLEEKAGTREREESRGYLVLGGQHYPGSKRNTCIGAKLYLGGTDIEKRYLPLLLIPASIRLASLHF